MSLKPLNFPPGIKRDGTRFDGEVCPDGEWVRWRMGRPRKIKGWQELNAAYTGPVRGIGLYSQNGFTNVFGGSSSSLEMAALDNSGGTGGITSVTPVGLTTDTNYIWQMAVMYDAVSTGAVLLAHPGPNLSNIDNSLTSTAFIGPADGSAALTAITGTDVSGGVCVLGQYAVYYGSDGHVIVSKANDPADITTAGSTLDANITGQKIVLGLPVRGGGQAPAGVLWSLDSIIRMNFVGGAALWSFDTVTAFSSVLSSSAIVEYDGQFFWPGHGRWLTYNGVVRDLPNNFNMDYFFDNLTPNMEQKVWGMAIPRYGEIWWFYPHGGSTECNNAIIFNIKENCWYDANVGAPGALRTSGSGSTVYLAPLLFSSEADSDGKYVLCLHETGDDRQTADGQVLAIESSFTTPDISLPATAGVDNMTRIERVEPDFVLSGEMNMTVIGNTYAQAESQESEPFVFDQDTTKFEPREQRRELRLKFTSNVAGGSYIMGQTLLDLQPGDGRP